MNEIKEIKCFRTPDGFIHETEQEASQWIRRQDFKRTYKADPIRSPGGRQADDDEVIEWLERHKTKVLSLLACCENNKENKSD